jgi:hypothetical protein
MKNLFDPGLVEDTKQRIRKLHPESHRQWGSMTPAATLAHCTCSIEMAMGIIRAKPAPFPAGVIGTLIKPLVFNNDKPMRRNSPSSPELFSADPHIVRLPARTFPADHGDRQFCRTRRRRLFAVSAPILRSTQASAVGHPDVQTPGSSPTAVRCLAG